jgi:hypothetical protein
LPAQQSAALANMMNTFFHAYHDGSYDSYCAFRFPAGAEFRWKTNKWGSLDEWMRRMKLPKALTRKPEEEKFKAFVNVYSGRRFYSNHITSVALDQSRLICRRLEQPVPKVRETRFFSTNYPERVVPNKPVWLVFEQPPTTVSIAAPFPNLGLISLSDDYSFVEFVDSLETVLARNKQVLVADAFFFVERSSAHPCTPVIVRWYWEPDLMQWLPDDLVFCGAAQKGDLLLVF